MDRNTREALEAFQTFTIAAGFFCSLSAVAKLLPYTAQDAPTILSMGVVCAVVAIVAYPYRLRQLRLYAARKTQDDSPEAVAVAVGVLT